MGANELSRQEFIEWRTSYLLDGECSPWTYDNFWKAFIEGQGFSLTDEDAESIRRAAEANAEEWVGKLVIEMVNRYWAKTAEAKAARDYAAHCRGQCIECHSATCRCQ